MTQRLFLHIGMMKSGTTYIQNLCDRSAEALLESGLLWLGGSAERQAAAVMEFRGSNQVMPGDEGAWAALRRELRRHPGDALLSHELLAGLPPEQIGPFLDSLQAEETVVILTVRDLSRVIPSRWQETTQNRGRTSWPTYLDAICDGDANNPLYHHFWLHTDVGRVLREWSHVVSPEQMRLVTVPRSGAQAGELWRRFASIVDTDPHIGVRTGRRENTSLGAVSAELMIRINHRVDDLEWPSYRMGFKAGMAKRGLARRAGAEPKVQIPPERWNWIEDVTNHMLSEIKTVGPAVVGDLDELIPLRPKDYADYPADWTPTDADLLAAALDGLESLGRQLAHANVALRKAKASSEQQDHPPRGLARVAAAARRRLPSGRLHALAGRIAALRRPASPGR